ncbi:MAG TPA: acido-empty-quinoprotein group A [Candidatus Acidoferrum sp.]|nr:acido-empty-quinoprotein group A [Candidatus Acidoferrum sp.]
MTTRALGCLFALLLTSTAVAQTAADMNWLLHPSKDTWPTYHGDYSGQRHSELTQITPANVNQLGLAWAFQTNEAQQIKGSPLLYDGILYVTTVDNLWAVDARTGRQLWRYRHPQNTGFHIGQRGVAIYGSLVYLTTPDAKLVALDRMSGEVKWTVAIADVKRGYWSTNAPLVIRNHLIVGVAGDFDNLPGVLHAYDPLTGALQWTYYSTLPPGAPGYQKGNAFGGQMWMTGTYDPQLNLLYVGTGNPTPTLNGTARPGDNLWTCSILALDPDTGTLKWGFQVSPHDTHDWDAAEVPVLVDAPINGTPRKLLLQASRNGYYVVLDRTNGNNLLTKTFAETNWSQNIDKDGHPRPDPKKDPSQAGTLVSPDESGATNYRSPSFDPATNLFIVSAADAWGIYFYKPAHGDYGWAGADYNIFNRGELRALDYATGEVKWRHPLNGGGGSAGVLTTASGLTFTGDSINNALALNTKDGSTLWHSGIGRVGNPPITYELDGRQYVLMASSGTLFAFVLPEGK